MNPLIGNWNTPFNIPPFESIKPEHFEPAIRIAIEEARKEINEIVESDSVPSFNNTIEALEESGRKLDSISSLLFNLNSADTNPGLQSAAQVVSPLLTRFSNDITLDPILFEKVKKVFDNKDRMNLSSEQIMLLKDKKRAFVSGGAGLDNKKKIRFREISERLAKLTLQFEENVLAETNQYFLHITSKDNLTGLPDNVNEAAAAEANSRGKDGWIFTLHSPSYVPFMQYSDNRDLRKQLFLAYSTRASKGNSHDNREIVREIVNLRLEKAVLLGYRNYAEYVLEDRMAGSPSRVKSFLTNLRKAARPFALKDKQEVENFASGLGFTEQLERWDWAYYSEKQKMKKLGIDDELLKPYFSLEPVKKAIFKLATNLYEISFKPGNDIPVYNEDVTAYEVTDKNGDHLAVLFIDFHSRKGKSQGAWMTVFNEQSVINGIDDRPVVSLVMNFPRATSSKPSLLSHNDLTTFLHEFGHALHGILSKCSYRSLSGTNVQRDFVELPSQLMENWAYEKEWLDSWATHFESGSKIPEELFSKIRKSLQYNEGYSCNRQLSFGFLDLAYHTITENLTTQIEEFEKRAMATTELFDPIEGINMSCAFGHLFAGGYAAGYYGYKWAEVLDADAFRIFTSNGLFDKKTASLFRKYILERGASDEPLYLYKKFAGREPELDALLERSGFKRE